MRDTATITREPKTHDYTIRTWGHDTVIHKVIDGGQQLKASGWGNGIRKGDYLLLPNGERGTRYQVESIEYKFDPRDMWSADLTFAPRDEVQS